MSSLRRALSQPLDAKAGRVAWGAELEAKVVEDLRRRGHEVMAVRDDPRWTPLLDLKLGDILIDGITRVDCKRSSRGFIGRKSVEMYEGSLFLRAPNDMRLDAAFVVRAQAVRAEAEAWVSEWGNWQTNDSSGNEGLYLELSTVANEISYVTWCSRGCPRRW